MRLATTVDPVCGKTLETWDRRLDRSCQTTVYHFCSATCSQRFSDDPAAYVAPVSVRPRERVTLAIFGLTCGGGGALSVERALQRLPGVIQGYVNPATEMAYVEYDPDQTDLPALEKAIEWAGCRTILPGGSGRERMIGRDR